jgi:hypothetical protein
MRHRPMAIPLVLALVGLALAFAACGGDDEDERASPAPSAVGPGEATPPSGAGAVFANPEFVKCMADRGFEIDSPEDIHSAPPDALQACSGSIH